MIGTHLSRRSGQSLGHSVRRMFKASRSSFPPPASGLSGVCLRSSDQAGGDRNASRASCCRDGVTRRRGVLHQNRRPSVTRVFLDSVCASRRPLQSSSLPLIMLAPLADPTSTTGKTRWIWGGERSKIEQKRWRGTRLLDPHVSAALHGVHEAAGESLQHTGSDIDSHGAYRPGLRRVVLSSAHTHRSSQEYCQ